MILKKITDWSFLLLIFSIGFMFPFAFTYKTYRVPFTDLIFLFVTFLFVVSLIFKQVKIRYSYFYLPLAIYLFSLFCSTIFSIDFHESAIKFLGDLYLIGLAVLSFNLACSINDFKYVFRTWTISTVISLIIGVITLILFYTDRTNILLNYTLSHYGSLPELFIPRIQSTFFNPNHYSAFLVISLLIILALFQLKWFNRSWLIVFLGLLLFISFFTLSPGLGGILLAFGIWFWLFFKERDSRKLSRLILVAGILCAVLFFISTLFSPVTTTNSPYYFNVPIIEVRLSPSARMLAWQTTLPTIAENPVFGRGLGLDVADAHYESPNGLQILGDSHQLWLNVAGQCGFFGFFAICFICIFFLRRIFPFSLANEKSVLQTTLGIAFICAFLYQGLSGSFENARYLWVLFGLLGSITENDS